jgi:surface carbohydrate biosynthesis protein
VFKLIVSQRIPRCDILVFDTVGAGWIDTCLPKGTRRTTISFRDESPIILSFRFLLGVLRGLFRYSPLKPAWISTLFLSGAVEHISPKIIVSVADNNLTLARFAENNKTLQVVLIQNAMRDTAGSITPKQKLPTYLAFGKTELAIFSQLEISCERYIPIGSVKLGLAMRPENTASLKTEEIAFISHYRPSMFDEARSTLDHLIEQNQRRLFSACIGYIGDSDRRLIVLTKTRNREDQKAERSYYINLAQQKPICFVTPDKAERELDSYLAGLSSALVVHPGSTLGLELFGAGKKIITGATADSELVSAWGISEYLKALPSFTKLESDQEMADFRALADQLLEMSTAEYLERTLESRSLLMSIPTDTSAHTQVRQIVEEMLHSV